MPASNILNPASLLTVKQMMNKNFQVLYPEDTLRTVMEYYVKYRIYTLPVVDKNQNLIGVLPKKRLYQALLDGAELDDPCGSYMVKNPVYISEDMTYNEVSLVVRITQSRVAYVVVVDRFNKVVGMIGTAEYLRESLNVIMASSALLESLFRANYEGIIITDRDFHIMRVNPAAEKMFKLSFADIKGKHINEILPEIVVSNERRLGIKASIRSVPVIMNQVPIVEDEVQIGTSFVFNDRTNIVKIAQELEMVKELQTTLSAVLEASSDGVFVTDSFGIIRYINEAAAQLLNKKAENIIDKPLKYFLPVKDPAEIAKTDTLEVRVNNINGKNCIVSHVPIKEEEDGRIVRAGIVSTVYLGNNPLTEEISRKWFTLNQQVQYYRNELEKRDGKTSSFDRIVTRNPEFIKMKKDGQRIARSSSTVLITGESGVGKDMFARAIHEASPRAKHPFVKVNCVAIPESLLESELFGYAPGAFTGASKHGKSGYFERANKGTIFLDEIGDMPLSIQVKILQVLQDKEFVRVGGNTKQEVDVRIIAATNKNLREAIANKTFREDLFYRLNVIGFHLPPLRDRAEDIIPLAETFIRKYNKILGSNVTGIKPEAKKALTNYSWPGNIRELENAIERAANYVWEGEISCEDLPEQIFQTKQEPLDFSAYRSTLEEKDKEMLLEALKRANGNKSEAARMLKISRSAFYEKLAKYDILN
ncbi:MAG: sigma 54-interacting transcriptional regulator [Peptococcaceae bacterium]|nr:sigma 54-interacting transcriptional regulator [Peptococcaceae bacterium]